MRILIAPEARAIIYEDDPHTYKIRTRTDPWRLSAIDKSEIFLEIWHEISEEQEKAIVESWKRTHGITP